MHLFNHILHDKPWLGKQHLFLVQILVKDIFFSLFGIQSNMIFWSKLTIPKFRFVLGMQCIFLVKKRYAFLLFYSKNSCFSQVLEHQPNSTSYVLWSSRISPKSGALIARYSQKKEWISFILYCFENPSNFETTGLMQVEFPTKTSPNEHSNQIENWKCHIFNFRLISLDRITYES